MPPIVLAPVVTVAADIVAWGVFHAATGYAVHRLPVSRLDRDTWLLRLRSFECSGRLYERIHIRAWKDRLPEAGAFFAGGVSKRRLPGRETASLDRFVVETRRAEYGHWSAMACGPLFVLWNPPVVAAVMLAYGVVVNAPFIAIQRYNRARVARLVARPTSRSPEADRPTSSKPRRRDGDSNGNNIP
jgi:glycosyl-4,4'-diaponeurosporenoate acyltransferase